MWKDVSFTSSFFFSLFLFFLFFYWAPVASATGSTAACRIIVQARIWKFLLVPPPMQWEKYGREISG
jgi:hypothetical protein